MAPNEGQRLKKELSLLDVYVIALGPMLSSGFFLLPGLAAAGVPCELLPFEAADAVYPSAPTPSPPVKLQKTRAKVRVVEPNRGA